MSELSKLTAAPRQIPELPGYTFSPFTWASYGAAEEEFDLQHRRRAGRAAVGLPSDIADKLIAAASFDGQSGAFAHGSFGFDRKVRSGSCLDFLLYLALKPCHPKLTRDASADLLTLENRRAVHRAVLECMDYDFTPKPAEDAKKEGAKDGADPNASGQGDAQPLG